MDKRSVLFTAPLDFDLRVWEEYTQEFDVYRVTESYRATVRKFGADYWVCDPKADFVIDKSMLDTVPGLKVLATPSTGLNHINLQDCRKAGVKVLSLSDNAPALEEISASSEFTLKLLIDAFRMGPDSREVYGKDIGIVGFGRIGKRLYKYLQAMGARYIVAHDPPLFGKASTDLNVMFKLSDAVVICCAYNKSTHHLITKELLESMPKGAVLVNTSRGEVIDEDGLLTVMEDRPDLKVAVDVVEGETTGNGEAHRYRLVKAGAIVTNHVAGETFDSRTKAARIILGLLRKEIHATGESKFTRKTGEA